MEDLSLQGLRLTDATARPDNGGMNGRKVPVIANCIAVTSYSGKVPAVRYHYDVTIEQVEEMSPGN